MFASTSAVVALLATSAAASTGSALIHNLCEYEIYMCNTPSAGGGYSDIKQTIQSGETYTQEWTILSTLQGWSIKLAPSEDDLQYKPMQYEYTYTGSSTIWYDISNINGDPFDGNWVMNSTNPSCKPRHSSYWDPYDDKEGMQDCTADSDIALYVCGNSTSTSTTSTSSSSSVVVASSPVASSSAPAYSSAVESTSSSASVAPSSTAPSSSAVASSSVAPASSSAPAHSAPAYSAPSYSHHWAGDNKAQSSSATTFATETTPAAQSTQDNGEVVTVYDVAYVTNYITQTLWVRDAAPSAAPVKRHQHHAHGHHA